ncbi:hypothetical protein ACO0R3_003796 [Hanseniaspora guilliermondii]
MATNKSYELNIFQSSIIQQCKIYKRKNGQEHNITYWLSKNDTIQVYQVIDSKPNLIRQVNKVFQNYNEEVTDINICGMKFFDDLDKVVLFGRDVYSVIPLSKIFDSQSTYINCKDLGSSVVSCTYWVTDVELCGNKSYVLTCYNEILIYELTTFKLLLRVKQNKLSSISYKGYLKLKNKELIVVSPSVLNGCLLWSYNIEKDEITDLYKLADNSHQGIIFDACIDNDYRFLITCSDDRSINLFDFKTGGLLQKLYGHVSRVWKVKFMYNDDERSLWGIISCSEDSKFVTWKLEKNELVLKKHESHEVTQIKNCWNLDYYKNQVLSCGNDGRVKLTFININEEAPAKSLKIELKKREMIKEVINVDEDEYIILSNSGNNLYTISPDNTTDATCDEIEIENFVKIISLNHNRMFLAIDKKNTIIILQKTNKINKIKEFLISDVTKILSLIVVSNIKDNKIEFILDSPNKNDNFILYSFDFELLEIKKLFSYSKMVNDSNQPLTVTSGYYRRFDQCLMVGTLNGKIICYVKDQFLKCIAFGEGAINTISETHLQMEEKHSLLLVSTRFQYGLLNAELTLKAFSNLTTSKIDNIKYISGSGFIMNTIKDGYFLEVNESKNMILSQHKLPNNLKTVFTENNKWVLCVYTNDGSSHIEIHKIRSQKDILVHEGTHGRETRCITVLEDDGNTVSFVTGSEDTTLKMHEFNRSDNPCTNSQLMTYRGHVSGLQTSGKIKFMNGKELFLSTSAKEELFMWSFNSVVDTVTNIKSLYMNLVSKLPTTKDLKKKKNHVNNIELRVTCFCFDSKRNILYTCYSNSMIRSWKVDCNNSNTDYKVHFINEYFYKKCSIFDCVLMNEYLVLGTSEGMLVSYKIEGQKLELKDCLKTHQNGIMCIENIKDDFLITGGDDNAISMTKLDKLTGIFETKYEVKNASNSAISSVKKITDDKFIFTSIDQLIGIYEMNYSNNTLNKQKIFFTNIADTQSIDTTKNLILIGGLGLSIYKELI